MSRARKSLLLLVAALALASGLPARADEDIFDTIQSFVSVSEVEATGIGPRTLIVGWTNQGHCVQGLGLQCATLATTFRIEIAFDEAGPYTKAGTFSGGCIRCVTQIQVGPDADVRPRFVRVVPMITVGGQVPNGFPPLNNVTVLEGKPSSADPALLGPLPPTDVRCNGGGELACVNVNHVTLTWTDNSDEKKFWIMRAEGPVNPNFGRDPVAEVPENRTTHSETLAKFSTVFQYRVVAVREQNIVRLDGNVTLEQSYTNCLSPNGKDACAVVVETAPLPPPTSPTGLVATFIPPSTARLTWTDREFNLEKPYIDEDGFFIEQTNGDEDWTWRFATMTTRPPFPGQGVVTWTDNALPPDTSRCYRVRSYRFGPAFSQYTNTSCLGSTPRAPTDLVATALSNSKVRLTWKDNSTSEKNFVVERCLGVCAHASVWVEIANDVPPNSTTFTDNNTIGLQTFSYRVFAANASGKSDPSNIAVITTPPAPIATPLNLQATGMSHAIRLDWDAVPPATGYQIEFQTQGGGWLFLASVGRTTTYIDTTSLGTNHSRCYRVRALSGATELSDPSNVACATTLGPLPPDGAPSDVTTKVMSNTAILLSWKDNATNESAFVIEYIPFPHLGCPQNNIVDASFRVLGTAPAQSGRGDTVNFNITGLIPHSAYFFRVRATNADGDSAWGAATPPFSAAFPSVTTCAQTFGPLRPTFIDPKSSGDLKASRCWFDIQSVTQPGNPDRAGGMLVYVNSTVPGTSLGHTDTLFVVAPGGTVPGANDDPAKNHYMRTTAPGGGLTFVGSSSDVWRIAYQFRRGVYYRIIVTSYAFDDPHWSSAVVEVRDVRVLADCPVETEPVPQSTP